MNASMRWAPVPTATFSMRPGCHRWRSEMILHEMCVCQPGWLAVQMVEADARFWHSSWPEACAAAEAEQLFGQSLKRRLKACCGLDTSVFQAGWPHTWW